ncbi:dnaJ homolog subfamily C member 9 isoform X2 [Colius striatus]|uniref:dnaJ homolog subfamily C member 9 isoform X2 n=1 Tax=Colius striatus TaxID=57412 RepID=UPI002B1E876A|nr:dnaJ homolog subfamily C member 9 isoform X2 [Colius striatus]
MVLPGECSWLSAFRSRYHVDRHEALTRASVLIMSLNPNHGTSLLTRDGGPGETRPGPAGRLPSVVRCRSRQGERLEPGRSVNPDGAAPAGRGARRGAGRGGAHARARVFRRTLARGRREARGRLAMGLLEQCEAAFGCSDLYRVLGVRREASPDEIRRGYHRTSLRVHPDRAEPAAKEEATRRFQILGKAYAVLSDSEQRAVYDERGTVDEEGEALRGERDWQEYWRLLFKKITVKDIEEFEKKYKDSEEELADIKAAYMDFEGDMGKIMESVLCVDYTDEPRIRKIIEKAIDSGELPSYKGFVKESKQKVTARKRKVIAAKTKKVCVGGAGTDMGINITLSIMKQQKTVLLY